MRGRNGSYEREEGRFYLLLNGLQSPGELAQVHYTSGKIQMVV